MAGLEYAFQATIKTCSVIHEPGVTKNVVKTTALSQVGIQSLLDRGVATLRLREGEAPAEPQSTPWPNGDR